MSSKSRLVPANRGRYAVCLVAMLMLASGCGRLAPSPAVPSKSAPSSNVSLADLRQRALQLPQLKPGTACPRSSGRLIAPAYGVAIGAGPAYGAGFGPDGILYFSQPAPAGSEFYGSVWSGAKVLWIIAPTQPGPVLIRGGRLDGPEGLRFNGGLDPAAELWIAAASGSPADWRGEPSYTRLKVPGCYAFQVDGEGFSETIVFEARVGP